MHVCVGVFCQSSWIYVSSYVSICVFMCEPIYVNLGVHEYVFVYMITYVNLCG